MGPVDLTALVKNLDFGSAPEVIVGLDHADDAGVYRLLPDVNLIVTADFITPVTDDPYWFGRIAGANSLSDIYAMGGHPKVALNLCGFPSRGVTSGALTEILRGGLDAAKLAGCFVIGGHTVKDTEIKYGLSVVGIARDSEIKTKAAARAGDLLILTKPIGTGLLIAGCKQKKLPPEKLLPAVKKMAELNVVAARAMVEFDCSAATDITGFGLAGHAWEMANASGVGIRFHTGRIPYYSASFEALDAGVKSAIKLTGDASPEHKVDFTDAVSERWRALVLDPQTSGGLLIAINPDRADRLMARLKDDGITDAAICGEVFATAAPIISFE
jgi:selenide,water dikinase